MYLKNFDQWNILKKKLDQSNSGVHIRAGEIRWASCGVNVGSEIDGKGPSFTRPVLILHSIGSSLALVIPLSTKIKNVAGYTPFKFREITMSLCIHQMRVLSQKRLLSRKGRISHNKTEEIKSIVKKFYEL